jgi:hypothetical protein
VSKFNHGCDQDGATLHHPQTLHRSITADQHILGSTAAAVSTIQHRTVEHETRACVTLHIGTNSVAAVLLVGRGGQAG